MRRKLSGGTKFSVGIANMRMDTFITADDPAAYELEVSSAIDAGKSEIVLIVSLSGKAAHCFIENDAIIDSLKQFIQDKLSNE